MRNQIIRHVTSSVAITETTTLQRWQNIISKRSELNELYLSLGYSQDQIKKLHELIDQCLSLVDFEIPDLPAFLSAVSSFLTSGIPQPHDSIDFGLIESLKKVRDVPTIRKILGNKLAQIAPMNRSLHFRFCLGLPEQIANLLEVRILDRVLLERTLEKLKNEIEYGPQSELVKQEALKSIDNVSHRISQLTEKDDPRAKLEKMAEKVEEATVWICHEDIEINGRRDRLNEVIVACESFREDFHPKMDVNTVGFAGGREGVQRAAKLYLDSVVSG